MKYIFINHGFMGSNIENWFPWLKNEIDNDENQVIIPQYPIDNKNHFYEYWKKVLDLYNNFNYINSNSIIADGEEIADVEWFSYDEILKMKNELRADGYFLSTIKNKIENKIQPVEIIKTI